MSSRALRKLQKQKEKIPEPPPILNTESSPEESDTNEKPFQNVFDLLKEDRENEEEEEEEDNQSDESVQDFLEEKVYKVALPNINNDIVFYNVYT